MSDQIALAPKKAMLPPPTPSRFKPRFFREEALLEERVGSVSYLLKKTSRKHGERSPSGPKTVWPIWNTPLHSYAAPVFANSRIDMGDPSTYKNANFERYLMEKAAEASRNGKMLRVLDIGVGTGSQWVGFLRSNPVEFFGTALSMAHISSELGDRVVRCSAANLHKHFPRAYFDLIVTHWGIHNQEKSAIENIFYLLKQHGEAIIRHSKISFDHYRVHEGKLYEVILPLTEGDPGVGFHFRKL